jgi:hypothetical protein
MGDGGEHQAGSMTPSRTHSHSICLNLDRFLLTITQRLVLSGYTLYTMCRSLCLLFRSLGAGAFSLPSLSTTSFRALYIAHNMNTHIRHRFRLFRLMMHGSHDQALALGFTYTRLRKSERKGGSGMLTFFMSALASSRWQNAW